MEEADFAGYTTRADVRCKDGRVIKPSAFEHMNGMQVPLVWQHDRSNSENVLGHVILESRDNGVYGYGFFNDTKSGQNARALVQHKDITAMSIYANELVEKGKQVLHGVIKEVSLVLAGANPGALIDYVRVAHGEGIVEELEDEAVIFTGLQFEHTATTSSDDVKHADTSTGDATVQEVFDTLNEDQVRLVNYLVGAALENAGTEATTSDNTTATHSENTTATHSENKTGDESVLDGIEHKEGSPIVTRNVFDQSKQDAKQPQRHVLSHSDVMTIVDDAKRRGSLREAVEQYALSHGIDDIDLMFPDARNINNTPEFNKRRTEWVSAVLGSCGHTPFARVKTIVADITQDEARAKGYVKGSYKKPEWFGIAKRVTTPTTVFKKQELDRDDMLDITDFDVVMWLRAEMRLMLDEEVARAILIGDGRDLSDADKVADPIGAASGAGIRSILHDHEYFTTTIEVDVTGTARDFDDAIDAIMDGMEYFKGSGTPDFYTTIRTLNKFLKLKDTTGRRIYKTRDEVAAALGVANIITVEPMNDETDLIGIVVNLRDYNVGADRGGEVNTFDDFDIDYNKQKYLMETRLSGALTKFKSALVIKSRASTDVLLAAPTVPTYVASTGVVTIPSVAHVTYKNAAGSTLSAGAQTPIADGASLTVYAEAASGYYFANTAEDGPWTFHHRA